MMIRTKTKYKVNATAPRLSDEDIDPIEKDDAENVNQQLIDNWEPLEQTEIEDIQNIINRLPAKQQFILTAFLDGLTYHDVNVTEKYWRYHFAKGIAQIKKELKI